MNLVLKNEEKKIRSSFVRHYFTNTDLMKRDDPYFQLGLSWGATSSEIKEAFRKRSLQLHPDVNKSDTPEEARRKFQVLQKAYAQLMGEDSANDDVIEKWRFAVWRKGDIIAEHRTDVAGVLRKRPAKPAGSDKTWNAMQLGHPDGRGVVANSGRGEYLGDGISKAPRSSSVGRGLSKWVAPKEYKQWDPAAANLKRADVPTIDDDKSTSQ
jgi:hypothetical protein